MTVYHLYHKYVPVKVNPNNNVVTRPAVIMPIRAKRHELGSAPACHDPIPKRLSPSVIPPENTRTYLFSSSLQYFITPNCGNSVGQFRPWQYSLIPDGAPRLQLATKKPKLSAYPFSLG